MIRGHKRDVTKQTYVDYCMDEDSTQKAYGRKNT